MLERDLLNSHLNITTIPDQDLRTVSSYWPPHEGILEPLNLDPDKPATTYDYLHLLPSSGLALSGLVYTIIAASEGDIKKMLGPLLALAGSGLHIDARLRRIRRTKKLDRIQSLVRISQ